MQVHTFHVGTINKVFAPLLCNNNTTVEQFHLQKLFYFLVATWLITSSVFCKPMSIWHISWLLYL